jgi:hypothetical protein
MRFLTGLIIVIASFAHFVSCNDDDGMIVTENDDLICIDYEPDLEVHINDTFKIDLNDDGMYDVGLSEYFYDNSDSLPDLHFSSQIIAFHDSILISHGVRSRPPVLIKYGDFIDINTVEWSTGHYTLRGISSAYKNTGIWGQGTSEGYIAFQLLENEKPRYGWSKLAVSDTSIIIKEYVMNKKTTYPIEVGIKP